MWLGHIRFSVPREYLIEKMADTGSTAAPDAKEWASKEPQAGTTNTGRDASKPSKTRWSTKAKSFEVFPRPDENPKPAAWWLAVFALRLLGFSLFNINSKLGLTIGIRLHIIKGPESKPQHMVSPPIIFIILLIRMMKMLKLEVRAQGIGSGGGEGTSKISPDVELKNAWHRCSCLVTWELYSFLAGGIEKKDGWLII